jgi:predicted  nucleic acid-binding Zn-ribbon protein
MATLKRVEKRLGELENWAKALEQGSGPAQTMENMNWLVGQTRLLGDRLTQAEQAVGELQGAIQANNDILQKFLDKHDMVRDWQVYIEELQKEAEDAVQESETESLDVQEQTEDGEAVGEGDA